MSHLPGKFVWFEHNSPDPVKARAFYEALLGWKIQSMPMGDQAYDMIMNGSDTIGGMLAAQPGAPSHWACYLSVTDVDVSFKAAIANGATSCLAPTNFGEIGRAAIVTDPTGANVCLWKGAQGDRPDVEKTAVGDWFWNELWTPDAAKALAFSTWHLALSGNTKSLVVSFRRATTSAVVRICWLSLEVLPRVIGLVIALPLLTVIADAIGLVGGGLLCHILLGMPLAQFLNRANEAIAATTF